MRIVYSYRDLRPKEQVFGDSIVIGRHEAGADVDLDLRFDQGVSHLHARIWLEEGRYWIEDLGSRNGTTVNGTPIQPKSAQAIEPGDEIAIGETRVTVDCTVESSNGADRSNITVTLDAVKPAYKTDETTVADNERRLAIFYELPLQFGGEMQVDALLGVIVRRLVEVVRGSTRGALVLRDSVTNGLLLKAHVPAGQPCVSMTLAQRALRERVAFVWQRGGDSTATQALEAVDCAMYAPLLWKSQVLGVVCVDNRGGGRVFDNDDLRLLTAVAQHAAMAVANQFLQEQLKRESAAKANLLRQFSPKIAERILKYRGLSPEGGERSYATILFADIRGFSSLTRALEPEAVVELLNSYFSVLTSVVFSRDGTVIQYVGDTIFAVFGSPEPDPTHGEKAVHAALDMQEKMRDLNSTREELGKSTCHIGIGVHCGEVVHGFVGVPDCTGFTVIGDAVNRTARYCSGAKADEVLISPELYERVWRIVREAEPLSVEAKFDEHLPAYRVTALWDR
jgi:adenylate cyclase